jgi:2'-5' RNA ligase
VRPPSPVTSRARLFVAIAIDSAAATAVELVSRDLSRRLDVVVPRPKITWVKPGLVHLTVRFIGEVPLPQVRTIVDVLAPPLTIPAFELTLGGVGVFPPRGAPRVIWVGVTDGAEAAMAVEREVSARLESAGVAREAREFRPHLTIGRVKDAGGLRSGALGQPDATAIARVRVERAILYQSRLSSSGPEHTAIGGSPLA